ncbi:MAG: hypothetical protein A2015_04050 [Spirochaetes bacterium GWF1_31_7]|nr:MAG: hypothetical protein A2Y30_14705 [Spirochaetes bacterium GWE1_32_154]OHD48664.1 MAG: hypothetical protein A2015_04050 [Spirochaetes bacterium GWF1_31_7]OHD50205.1 MAG: hypothetical protein A2Y29_12750 [Spirochaetes bacterium GWE2_31_10]OHD82409.1 MAG: hypothetical protein A2355_01100 [Spirochaetes bacterium RIFOXYB1_FULL_32_8]HBD94014.1 hypothetical protein [Spirochaetia bacterium]
MKRLFLLLTLVSLSLFTSKTDIFAAKKTDKVLSVTTADLIEMNLVQLKCSGLTNDFAKEKFAISPDITITKMVRKGPYLDISTKEQFKEGVIYTLTYGKTKKTIGLNTTFLVEQRFNDMYSDKKMGYTFENGNSTFRVFIPRGIKVNIVVFNKYDDENGQVIEMKNDGNQVFEYSQPGEMWGKYYGYQIIERSYSPGNFIPNMPQDTIFADPYGKINASNNVFPAKYRTLIYDDSKFDWQNTKTLGIDINDTIMLESHVRDLTAHPSAKSKFPGTFKGLIDAEVGGINYIKKLGVNAVEFLPLHDFANTEPPYKIAQNGIRNVWNVYSRNYWGYMTNSFFSPETYYGSDGSMDSKKWNGTDGKTVEELKTAIREFHKNGIAVMLDVVYNHISQYDVNSLKLIDYDYYFKKVEKTGCGNEVETRRKMVRRMVLDSLKYWMNEYKIDGFRFDLAASHDVKTVQTIYDELRLINPKVYIVAEPWGGEGASTKADFKKIGWSLWSDEIRNSIRGGNNRPTGPGTSFMLGTANNASGLINHWKGTTLGNPYQSVGYIESHDDATIGDIVRILSGAYSIQNADGSINRIKNLEDYLKLNPELINASKVGATALFLTQGPIMMHLGQEWARGKVTPDLTKYGIEELDNKGKLGSSSDNVVAFTPTPNSYSADNETNYINFDHIKLNQDLFNYYQGLIKLRKSESLLGNAKPEQVTILDNANKNSLGVIIGDKIIGLVNSDKTNKATYTIPTGKYKVVADKNKAGTDTIREVNGGEIIVEEASSIILIKL